MKLKNNFQRHLVLNLLVIFNNLCLSIFFIILRYVYNVKFLHILLIGVLLGLFYCFYWEYTSKRIFGKYCNKECHNCSMWHCDYHYKDGKYVK